MLYVNPIANLDAYRDAGLPDAISFRYNSLYQRIRCSIISISGD